MLRGLGRLEVFPGDDVGARNKLKAFLGLDGEFDYERGRGGRLALGTTCARSPIIYKS